jgi:hypothetical protein
MSNSSSKPLPGTPEYDAAMAAKMDSADAAAAAAKEEHSGSAAQQPNAPLVRTSPQPLRWDGASGELVHVTRGRVNVSGSEFNTDQGILGTATTKHGGPVRGDLTGDHLVKFQGLEMTVRDAEYAGLVKRNEHGRYVEASADEKARALAPKGDSEGGGFLNTAAMQEEHFPEEIEQTIAALAGDVDGRTLGSIITQYAERVALDPSHRYNVGDVVSQTGMTPQQAENFMKATLAAFEAQYRYEIGKQGINDVSTFEAWARERHPARWKAAMVAHGSARTLSGYRSLAAEFMKSTTPTEGALNRAGYKTKIDDTTGEPMVFTEAGWESVAAAARRGRI